MHLTTRTSARRTRIRLVSFSAAMAAVLFFCICMQRQCARNTAAAQNRLRYAVLAHMNEENAALRASLSESDQVGVLCTAQALCGYAALFSSCGCAEAEAPLITALADTAQFYAALVRTARQTEDGGPITDSAFWQSSTDIVSAHIASLALSLSDRLQSAHPSEAELTAAHELSAFTASFRCDPLRLPAAPHPEYRFDGEMTVTQAEARQILRTLLGTAASFLGNTVTDDAHGCYVFSCQNGYAEISHSGHLLSYAFYPRSTGDVPAALLSDEELSARAAEFLKKAGIPAENPDTWEDAHGVRRFLIQPRDGGVVTVGLRMYDGAVVRFGAEAYYRRE